MKLSKAFCGKGFPLILMYFVASILCCLTVPIATAPSSTVTFRVEPNVTSGVAPGELVMVDVYIDAPDPESAIVGWTISIRVNPDVLEPGYDFDPYGVYWAVSGMEGYFLYDWATSNNNTTMFDDGARDVTAGTIVATIEAVAGWSGLKRGVGANGTGKLVTFFFTSESATGYSPIEITEAYYYTSWDVPDLDKRVPDVIIHGHYNEPTFDVAVTSVSAPSQVTLGDIVTINVTVANLGGPVALNLTLTYNRTIIETRLMSLGSTTSKTEFFTWDTAGLTPGEYVINATAIVPGDADLTNNFNTTTITLKQVVFPVTVDGLEFNVIIESNSTVSDFDFRKGAMEISFNVTGPSGTLGFCNVTIPMSLMKGEPWVILVRGVETTYFESDNGTHTFLYFTYAHTTHNVKIRGTWVVPEFPTLLLLLLTLVILAVSMIILKQRTQTDPLKRRLK